jgi:hypothetical protein
MHPWFGGLLPPPAKLSCLTPPLRCSRSSWLPLFSKYSQVRKFNPSIDQLLNVCELLLSSLFGGVRGRLPHLGCVATSQKPWWGRDRKALSWLGIPIFGSNFWDPHWKQNTDSILDSKDSGLFLNSAVEKLRNQNSIPNFGIPIKNKHRISIHLIPHKIPTVIGQPVDLTMLNCMDVGTIPGKAIFLPIQHLPNMSRCVFCGLNNHATKLTSTQNE